jgi:hypothetical protein
MHKFELLFSLPHLSTNEARYLHVYSIVHRDLLLWILKNMISKLGVNIAMRLE